MPHRLHGLVDHFLVFDIDFLQDYGALVGALWWRGRLVPGSGDDLALLDQVGHLREVELTDLGLLGRAGLWAPAASLMLSDVWNWRPVPFGLQLG